MFVTNHVLAGAAIGHRWADQPTTAFLVGVLDLYIVMVLSPVISNKQHCDVLHFTQLPGQQPAGKPAT